MSDHMARYLIENITIELCNPECADPQGLAFNLSIFFGRRASAEEAIRNANAEIEQAKLALESALETARLARARAQYAAHPSIYPNPDATSDLSPAQ